MELQQHKVVHIHRIYSKSMRDDAPTDILIKQLESKESLDKPTVKHKIIMRKLRLKSRTRYENNVNINSSIQKSVKVKVRRSKHKGTHHHHHHTAPYPTSSHNGNLCFVHVNHVYLCTSYVSMTHAAHSCCLCK